MQESDPSKYFTRSPVFLRPETAPTWAVPDGGSLSRVAPPPEAEGGCCWV
jgi:hypothetical protein